MESLASKIDTQLHMPLFYHFTVDNSRLEKLTLRKVVSLAIENLEWEFFFFINVVSFVDTCFNWNYDFQLHYKLQFVHFHAFQQENEL